MIICSVVGVVVITVLVKQTCVDRRNRRSVRQWREEEISLKRSLYQR